MAHLFPCSSLLPARSTLRSPLSLSLSLSLSEKGDTSRRRKGRHVRYSIIFPCLRYSLNAFIYSCFRGQPLLHSPTYCFSLPPATAAADSLALSFRTSNPTTSSCSSSAFSVRNSLALPQCSYSAAYYSDGPVAPLPFSLADRDVQAIVDAYKNDPGNPKYAFKHLLFSVTDPAFRVKPAGVSDIMWAEAMGKLEGMDGADREKLWPQLVLGFKDLSQRLKLQDEAILSDAERLRMTQMNVKMLQRHFQADTLPWIERMRQKEQGLQRRLLRLMRIVEALEGKGFRMPLMKGEVELAEKLGALARQLKGPGAELARRVHNLLSVSRVHANAGGFGYSLYLPGSARLNEQSLVDMQEVLQQQTEAIARLGNVLKRDIRDMEIIMSEDSEMLEDGGRRAS